MRMNGNAAGSDGHNVTWATAQARSAEVRGFPALATRSEGWLGRHARRVSSNLANLPMFRQSSWAEKEKLGRGRYQSRFLESAKSFLRVVWRLRFWILLVLTIILAPILFYTTRELRKWHLLRREADAAQHYTASIEGPHGAAEAARS